MITTDNDIQSDPKTVIDEEAQANNGGRNFQTTSTKEKKSPVDKFKRIKLKRVPSAVDVLNLSRRSSAFLQRGSGKSRRKRGKQKRRDSDNFHYRSRPSEADNDEIHSLQDYDKPQKKRSSCAAKRVTPWVNYEAFQWTWFITLCILGIVDRFKWNVWPRQTYSIGAGSAGSDRVVGFKPG